MIRTGKRNDDFSGFLVLFLILRVFISFIWWNFWNRAFVEFSHNPMEGFKILPAVYMSIKMSQLKIPLELDVHYPDDIKRQLQPVPAASMESLR